MKLLLIASLCVLSTWAVPAQVKSNSGRIIGGKPARAGDFPYAAAIYAQTPDAVRFCGGALLNNQFVISSAQCVNEATLLTIHLGSNTLQGQDSNRVTVATDNYILHPNYDETTLENNIALIELRLPIAYSPYLSAILLPNLGLQADTPVVAVGWGQISDEVPGLVNELNEVELVTISTPECNLFYGGVISDGMTCAVGNLNEGTCIGDLGGPLVEHRGSTRLVGIASFLSSSGCESTDPSGYTRIYAFVDWINSVINP